MKTKLDINRREFMRKVALGAVAPMILNYTHRSFAKTANDTLNVGVIGTGGRGRNAHLHTLIKFQDVKVTAICDIRKQNLDKALEIVGSQNPKTYRNYEDLIRQKDLDCVFVATPPDQHKVQICESLYAGYSVYVDKPMALTITDCNAIERAIKNAKGVFIVGQQLRYSPSHRRKIKLIHDGEIGKVALVNINRFGGGGRLPGGGGKPRKKWILSIEQGGDHVLEYAVHWFDYCNWVLQAHPIRAAGIGGQALFFNEEYDRETMDHWGLIFEYPDNKRVFYTQGSLSAPGFDRTQDVVYGTKGAFDLNSNKLYKRVGVGEPKQEPVVTEDPNDDKDESVWDYLCCKDFFECHRTGKKPFADFDIAKTTILTALLARKAVYEQRVVTWDDLLREGAPVKRVDL